MKQLRLANSIIKMMVKDRLQYPGRLIVDTIGIAARCGILLILYWYVFRFQGGSINGVTFPIAAWSMFLYFSFMTLQLRHVGKLIGKDIQSGTIEIIFAKPVQYLWYRAWWQFGSGLYPFLVNTILGVIILALTVGIPETMQTGFFAITLVTVFILGSLLSLAIYAIVGLIAFWIEDPKPLYWVVDKAVMILGGSYLPVAFFPKIMYQIAVWSPFGASQFVTHTVYENWSETWMMKIGIQLLWILIIGVVVAVMFNKARKKVSVNGG